MVHHNFQNSASTHRHHRQSILASSDARADSLPIDCILVYNDEDHDDYDARNNQGSRMGPSERRRTFEEYLTRKQGLILQHYVCKNTIN